MTKHNLEQRQLAMLGRAAPRRRPKGKLSPYQILKRQGAAVRRREKAKAGRVYRKLLILLRWSMTAPTKAELLKANKKELGLSLREARQLRKDKLAFARHYQKIRSEKKKLTTEMRREYKAMLSSLREMNLSMVEVAKRGRKAVHTKDELSIESKVALAYARGFKSAQEMYERTQQ